MTDNRNRRRQGWTIVITAAISMILLLLAMNFATPEKSIERSITHRLPIADPQFRREMSVILGPSIIAGNRVTALQNGMEIFPAMLDAIRGAQVSVNFETYIYWSGEIGERFTVALSERALAGIPVNVTIDLAASYFLPDELIIQALLAARGRNVAVRLLVPGPHLDSETVRLRSRADWGQLLTAGIDIYEYQPTMLHTKLLVVDKEFVSVGSTNFDPRSFRLNDEASLNIYEHDFAQQMSAVYEADLASASPYTLEMWEQRPLKEKLAERLLWPIRSQL